MTQSQSQLETISSVRRVNAPYTSASESIPVPERAVFWFGRVSSTDNYVDTRVIYNDEALYVTLHIFDKRLWYDTNPTIDELVEWDAASLYLSLDGNVGNAPNENSYRFIAQLDHFQPRGVYQAAYEGNTGVWAVAPLAFETETGWRGQGLNNDAFAHGWHVTFKIPFASLNLANTPSEGTLWGLSLRVHDRDDAAGSPISGPIWPENSDELRPATWGQLRFGVPSYNPPFVAPFEAFTIRQGLDDVSVVDAHVGGHITCGGDAQPGVFENWGSLNYAGYPQINIQNQWDVSDWPCFSRFYITFPLDILPPGKTVFLARLSLNQFGNAGQGEDPDPQSSYIQVLTNNVDWDENSITWNNAPLALENVGGSWVDPIESGPNSFIEREWDVSRAVVQAYEMAKPLRLVLYSADSAQHSGKYFLSSDIDDWAAGRRPTLTIILGDPKEPSDWTYLPLVGR